MYIQSSLHCQGPALVRVRVLGARAWLKRQGQGQLKAGPGSGGIDAFGFESKRAGLGSVLWLWGGVG